MIAPTTISPVTPVDLEGAVYDFILKYAYPAFEADSDGNYPIYNAHNNRMSLPADSEDFAVYQVLNQNRVGTNVEIQEQSDDVDTYNVMKQVTSDIQLDFYSTDEATARGRAEALELLVYGGHAGAFFNDYGIDVLYSDTVRDIGIVGTTEQYVSRWGFTMSVVYYAAYELTYDYATAVDVTIENVDVHHPDTGED